MCFRLFIFFVFAVWLARLVWVAMIWAGCRKEADQIIANGDGPSTKIDQLAHIFRNKSYLGKRDKTRLNELLSIRDKQLRGARYVESKVREKKSDL